MPKHIKFIATLVNNNTMVSLEIVEQTHKGTGFGNLFGPGGANSAFKASNGVAIKSSSYPENVLRSDDGCVYVRGDTGERDRWAIKFTPREYDKFKQAVLEYNEYFKDKG